MTLYTIQATILDSNGTRVASSDARTLGDAYGRWYTDRGAALDAIDPSLGTHLGGECAVAIGNEVFSLAS